MFKFIYLFILITYVSTIAQDSTKVAIDSSKSKTTFFMNRKIGFTYQNISKSGLEDRSLQWLATINAKITYENLPFSLGSSLFINYGQMHREGKLPDKTQDNFIASVTPAFLIDSVSSLRAFLETTFETTLRPGKIGTQTTTFLDPGFLYQSLFLGQKQTLKNEPTKMKFEIIYGLGYAYQLTIRNKFVLNDPLTSKPDFENPTKKVSFESGVSGIIETNYTRELAKELTFNMSLKTTLFARDSFWKKIETVRVSTITGASIKYKFLSLDYSNRILYDYNLSKMRDLNESLVLSLNWSY